MTEKNNIELVIGEYYAVIFKNIRFDGMLKRINEKTGDEGLELMFFIAEFGEFYFNSMDAIIRPLKQRYQIMFWMSICTYGDNETTYTHFTEEEARDFKPQPDQRRIACLKFERIYYEGEGVYISLSRTFENPPGFFPSIEN